MITPLFFVVKPLSQLIWVSCLGRSSVIKIERRQIKLNRRVFQKISPHLLYIYKSFCTVGFQNSKHGKLLETLRKCCFHILSALQIRQINGLSSFPGFCRLFKKTTTTKDHKNTTRKHKTCSCQYECIYISLSQMPSEPEQGKGKMQAVVTRYHWLCYLNATWLWECAIDGVSPAERSALLLVLELPQAAPRAQGQSQSTTRESLVGSLLLHPGGKVLVGWGDLELKQFSTWGHEEASPLAMGAPRPHGCSREHPVGPRQRDEGRNLLAVLLQGWRTPTELSMWTLCEMRLTLSYHREGGWR